MPKTEAERIACAWGRRHIDDPRYDADPRWEFIWSIIAGRIRAELAELPNSGAGRGLTR